MSSSSGTMALRGKDQERRSGLVMTAMRRRVLPRDGRGVAAASKAITLGRQKQNHWRVSGSQQTGFWPSLPPRVTGLPSSAVQWMPSGDQARQRPSRWPGPG